jgi:hypothetical protein
MPVVSCELCKAIDNAMLHKWNRQPVPRYAGWQIDTVTDSVTDSVTPDAFCVRNNIFVELCTRRKPVLVRERSGRTLPV